MKKIIVLIIVSFFLTAGLYSCKTVDPEPEQKPEPVITEQTKEPEPEQPAEVEKEEFKEEFVVTKELYVETFDDIQAIIDNLNRIIASMNFKLWKTYLTEDYIAYYSNPKVLKKYSELYKKRGYNYKMRTLEDYFTNLVVISRKNAVLDDIIFLDTNHVKAMTEIKGKLSVLYYLEKIENVWKIGLTPEN